MKILIDTLIALIAIQHFYILYMEMFAWETLGKKTFKGSMPDHLFSPTKTLAANQGLYNGFLATGLLWSLWIVDPIWAKNIAVFFLFCVMVAGIFGAMTASKKIFFVQALPAIITLCLLLCFN